MALSRCLFLLRSHLLILEEDKVNHGNAIQKQRLCRVTSASTHFTHHTNYGLGRPSSPRRTHSKLSV